VVFLLLGAVVNVAVAWWCSDRIVWAQEADFAMTFQSPERDQSENWAIVYGFDGLGCSKYAVLGLAPKNGADISVPIREITWSRIGLHRASDCEVSIEAEEAAGWPSLSFWRAFESHCEETRLHRSYPGTLVLRRSPICDAGECGREDFVGYRPIWRGFAFNTVFYATILWLFFVAPFNLRRWRRMRNGLCMKCAYPIGESDICTECGAQLNSRSSTVNSEEPSP